jgi:hypothetical protein
MPVPRSRRELSPRDLFVLLEIVRFGVMASDQIKRRYASAMVGAARLKDLITNGLIYQRPEKLAGRSTFSVTDYGFSVAHSGLKHWKTNSGHVAHDVALVDLADYLELREPGATWKAESEISTYLAQAANGVPVAPPDYRHRPDGLLLVGGKVVAIELEHTTKPEWDYGWICRWFAQESRVNEVRWYVDNSRTDELLRKVNRDHGFEHDITVSQFWLPPGVVVRRLDS